MPTVREHFDLGSVAPVEVKLPDADEIWKISSEEIVGIEVEVENQNHRRPTARCWTVTEDGSLRNGGVEFVSRPIKAKDAPAAIQHLFKGDFDQDYCFSPRTSVHVHLNMLDVPTEKVVDLLLIYSLFEKSLYRFVGKGRWKNIYCTPITESLLLMGIAERGLGATWEKYTGLNLLPLRDKGTIEFRHMHGTIDAKKLCIWIDLITRLKAYVLSHKTEDIRRTIINFNGGQMDVLSSEVFGNLAEFLQLSDPSEVVNRLALVKMSMVKSSSLNSNILKSVKTTSKFFQVRG